MKKLFTLAFTAILVSGTYLATGQTFTPLASDSAGDHSFPSLPDGKSLSYAFDQVTDSLLFKVEVYGTIRTDSFGLNIVIDDDLNPSTGESWWGSTPFTGDVLVTVWVTDSAGTYIGTIGIADSAGMAIADYTNMAANNISIVVDVVNNAYIIGMLRTDIFPASINANVIAAVGSNQFWNDDIPNSGSGRMTETISSVRTHFAAENKLRMMPNPSHGPVVIHMQELDQPEVLVMVRNLVGQVVYNNSIPVFNRSLNQEIDLSHVNAGVYLVQVIHGDQVTMRKLLIR
jgi:hypothetical protein